MNNQQLREVKAETARKWLELERAVLIDVREPDEYVREHIPQARLVPLSGFSDEDFPNEHDKIAIVHCRSGSRTQAAAATILQAGFAEVYQLKGGLKAWRKAGYPVNENRRAPISIMRQVQMAAGGMVVLGIILAVLFSPWFMALSAFVGAGLVFAGASGTCAMANILSLMPWNKATSSEKIVTATVNR